MGVREVVRVLHLDQGLENGFPGPGEEKMLQSRHFFGFVFVFVFVFLSYHVLRAFSHVLYSSSGQVTSFH